MPQYSHWYFIMKIAILKLKASGKEALANDRE